MSWASGPKKKKKQTSIYEKKNMKVDIRQTEMGTGVQTSTGGTDDEDREWATTGVPGS